eukprot:7382698-Prymnesium_polylepis.1
MSSTASSEAVGPLRSSAVGAQRGALPGATELSSDGTIAALPSMRSHRTGSTAVLAAALGRTAERSAPSPSTRPILLMPLAASIAAIRSLAAPRTAIPTSAHAPHCTLAPGIDCARRCVASVSRRQLAAA